MKIGLLDHMGWGNLGDAATQDAVIGNIKKRLPNARIVGFSLAPHDTTARHGIPCHPIRWSYRAPAKIPSQTVGSIPTKPSLKSVLKNSPLVYTWAKPLADLVREAIFWVRSYRVLRSLDLLIISGGGQLDELWHGPWSQPYTVFKFSLLARLARKKLYFLNVGVGPLERRLSKVFAKWAVRLAHYRSFRDRDSQERMLNFGVKGATHAYPDLVYALEVAEPVKRIALPLTKPTVGLNPIGFCDPHLWPRKDAAVYHGYLEKLANFSLWLLEHGYNLRVYTTDILVDRNAIQDLKVRLHSRLSSSEAVDEIFRTPSESVKDVLSEMSEFDYVVTSKFHGIIFSHLLMKPVISLSYQRKMDFAMRAVGQGHFSASIDRFNLDWLIKAFCSLVDESKSIRSELAAAVEANASALSQQFDTLFFSAKIRTDVTSQHFSSQGAADCIRHP
jgi:polysaccharide pyruvyl transferase WcaK-like protein